MFKLFYVFGMIFSMISSFSAECMFGAYVNVMNSTNEIVRLSYKNVVGDISSVTGELAEKWNGKTFEIQAGKAFLLAEVFSKFDQFAGTAEGKKLMNIQIEYAGAVVGIVTLVCSMYCPNPFFMFENVENSYGIILDEKQSHGGGITIFNIRHFSNRSF